MKTPKTTPNQAATFTMRCPPTLGSWLFAQSEALGKSATEITAGMVEHLRLWFGLGAQVAALLEARAKEQGLTQRGYVIDLLQRRAEWLQKHGVGTQRGEFTVLQARVPGMTAEEKD